MTRSLRPAASPRRHLPAVAAILLATALCGGLARSAAAQTTGTGGGSDLAGTAATDSTALAPSSGSLLQGGPPQAGGLGGGNNLSNTNGESMRDRIDSALGLGPPSTVEQPAVQFVPAITLLQGWTSNANSVPGASGNAAFTTQIAPSISVNADTRRVQGSFTYAPNFIIYEPSRGENTAAQNLSLHAHTTIVPDAFFVDLSGFAARQTISGGYGPSGTVVQNQSNTSQNYSFSLAPYWLRHAGDIGTVEIGGSVAETAQLVPGGTIVAPAPGLPPTSVQSYSATPTGEHIAFASGEYFGRWLSNAYLTGMQGNGNGVMSGAYRYEALYEAGYAITRRITALASIGWDDIYYGGFPPVRVNSALWNIGAQMTPNPDSQITVRYGRKDGIDAPYVAAVYQLSPRTRITANYSVTLSTDLEQLNNDLLYATTDSFGNPINSFNGQPLLAANNFLGIFTNVYKLTTGSVTGTLLLNRDTFQIGFNHQSQISLNVAEPGLVAYDSTGNYGTLSWQHDLSEVVKAQASVQYGSLEQQTGGISQTATVFAGGAQVSYAISDKLSATLQYSYTSNVYRGPFPGYNVNLILAGLHKTF